MIAEIAEITALLGLLVLHIVNDFDLWKLKKRVDKLEGDV
jgi:hypothetical protein